MNTPSILSRHALPSRNIQFEGEKMHSMICFSGEQQTAVQFHHPHLDAAPKPLDD